MDEDAMEERLYWSVWGDENDPEPIQNVNNHEVNHEVNREDKKDILKGGRK